jgi:hypothetical protein
MFSMGNMKRRALLCLAASGAALLAASRIAGAIVSVSQIDREWAENHGRSCLGTGGA